MNTFSFQKSRFFISLIRYFSNFFYTQLALTIASSVILIGWGLDISLMSLVGNLVFGPFLLIFLLLSSLLMFATLLGLPCGFIAKALCAFTHWWNRILKQGSISWMFGFPNIGPILLICLLLGVIITFYRVRNADMKKKLLRMITTAVLIFSVFFVVWRQTNRGSNALSLSEHLYVIKMYNTAQIIAIDNGFFNRKQSIEKAIDYDFKPWLTKSYGHVTIRELRLQKPGLRSFQAALAIIDRWNIKAIWIPFFNKELSTKAWRYFFRLKRTLKQRNIEFIRYNQSSTNEQSMCRTMRGKTKL